MICLLNNKTHEWAEMLELVYNFASTSTTSGQVSSDAQVMEQHRHTAC